MCCQQHTKMGKVQAIHHQKKTKRINGDTAVIGQSMISHMVRVSASRPVEWSVTAPSVTQTQQMDRRKHTCRKMPRIEVMRKTSVRWKKETVTVASCWLIHSTLNWTHTLTYHINVNSGIDDALRVGGYAHISPLVLCCHITEVQGAIDVFHMVRNLIFLLPLLPLLWNSIKWCNHAIIHQYSEFKHHMPADQTVCNNNTNQWQYQ